MNKFLTSCITLTAMVLSPALRSDMPEPALQETVAIDDSPAEDTFATYDTTPEETYATDDDAPEGTDVGEASNTSLKQARRKQWQNIGLAVAAVAIAITAIILVGKNQGHHHHHHRNNSSN